MKDNIQIGLNSAMWIDDKRLAGYYEIRYPEGSSHAVVEIIEESPGEFVFGNNARQIFFGIMIEAGEPEINDIPMKYLMEGFIDIIAGLERDMCKALNEKRSNIIKMPTH